MRITRNNNIVLEKDKTVCISFGADYCAEHEWGIDDLKYLFGIKKYDNDDATNAGIARRTITRVPTDNVIFIDDKPRSAKGFTALICTQFASEVSEIKTMTRKQLAKHFMVCDGEGKLSTAWDGRSFAIISTDKEERNSIREVTTAMMNLDLAIFLGNGGPFQSPGLILSIPSNTPSENLETMKARDIESAMLNQDVKKTGILETLKAAGKKWHALSPKRDEKAPGGLVFWLNPQEQSKNNYGWFNVEQLKQWAEGKGPIPKGDIK